MADKPILHGEIQFARNQANDICERYRFKPDGSIWERFGDCQWIKIGVLPRMKDREAFMAGTFLRERDLA